MDHPGITELKGLLPRAMLADWVRLGGRAIRLFKDRHHPDQHAALLERLLEETRRSVALCERRRALVPAVNYPPELPISARREEIVAAIRAHSVVVIAGETGSGKTTQIPKMCLEAGLGIEGKIGCTQPRRVAALSISRRIAEELGVDWGREVGCKIRFDDRSSAETYIKLMTDGILLAETQGDPTLAEYNAIIIDEAHERSLNIDFLLGCLKKLLTQRRELKLIITSATIDTEMFSRHFGGAPIVEVSGRTYPVEVAYRPLKSDTEERGDVGYVDGAVETVETILLETGEGDILVFMPAEKDIRETVDRLAGRFRGEVEAIPLFGRLSAGEQQRVFAASARRKIVVSTNLAETSLTIPGIRYVVDTGLARISRYTARTRTRRLPIEPVSQSSANQRKGRAGRVEAGVCIRLYAEEDFLERPAFTQPEIQRANLAEVILRMKAFRLGEIESFPFIQPPTPAAIAGGYALLQELGALDDQRTLTSLGADLARLPIDPTLGRMLLQSQAEHATRELLIIASGLSIQDPRERPLDRKAEAEAAHKRFNDVRSDFVTLLNIWNAVHDEWESLRTQSQRRRFCREHFLSYLRMREWQDLHAQLHDALEELGTVRLNESSAAYDAIHRSILAGLVGHVALRQERNAYKAVSQRAVLVFPGSVLHARGEPARPRAGGRDRPSVRSKSAQPEWLVAGEIVETSQLFARTLAGIDPAWILQVAPHCCKITHVHPRWQVRAGQVLIDEVATLYGLEVQRRKVAYGNLNAKDATDIFIRQALIAENLLPGTANGASDETDDSDEEVRSGPMAETPRALPAAYRFLEQNRALRQKIENWQTRVRRYAAGNLDEAMFRFYAGRLEKVSSVHELNRFVRDAGGPGVLVASEADLIGGQPVEFDAQAFPDAVTVGGQPVAVTYAYAPGEEHDGVTVQLPFALARSINAGLLEWAVPGQREEKAGELLRALPKTLRRELMPLAPKAVEIAAEFTPTHSNFFVGLAAFISRRYGVDVPASVWGEDALPRHLQPRYEIVGQQGRLVLQGRNLEVLQRELGQTLANSPAETPAWEAAARRWERFALDGWTFGDLPERLTIAEDPLLPLYAWPGLALEDGNVNVRLFRSQDAARAETLAGFRMLVERAISKELAWVEKDLRGLSIHAALCAGFCAVDDLRSWALDHLKREALAVPAALTQAAFETAVETARGRLTGKVQGLVERVGEVLRLRQQVLSRMGPGTRAPAVAARRTGLAKLSDLSQLALPGSPAPPVAHALSAELQQQLPADFLRRFSAERLAHAPRYLKALLTRLERAALNPAKDAERAARLRPYLAELERLTAQDRGSEARQLLLEDLHMAIEEYRVSLFAQELGTAFAI